MRQAFKQFEAARSNVPADHGLAPTAEGPDKEAWSVERDFRQWWLAIEKVLSRDLTDVLRGLTHRDPKLRMSVDDALRKMDEPGDGPRSVWTPPAVETLAGTSRLIADFALIETTWPYVPGAQPPGGLPTVESEMIEPEQTETAITADGPWRVRHMLAYNRLSAAATFCVSLAFIQAAVWLLPIPFSVAPVLFWPIAPY